MELLVHVSTSGHLLVACSQAVVGITVAGIKFINVHVIMGTPTPHLPLWAMTIFARVLQRSIIIQPTRIRIASIPMLLSGMARCVREVAAVVSSTILRGSPRT